MRVRGAVEVGGGFDFCGRDWVLWFVGCCCEFLDIVWIHVSGYSG